VSSHNYHIPFQVICTGPAARYAGLLAIPLPCPRTYSFYIADSSKLSIAKTLGKNKLILLFFSGSKTGKKQALLFAKPAFCCLASN